MKLSAFAFCTCVISVAHADIILDQSFSPGSSAHEALINTQLSSISWAQTFTAGVDGLLAELDLKVFKRGAVTEPLQVDIRSLALSGAPTEADSGSNVLASWSVDQSAFGSTFLGPGAFVRIALPTSVAITAGDELAIVLRSTQTGTATPSYRWQGVTGGGYAAGSSYLRSSDGWSAHDSDRAFRTFVAVPEPSSIALLGVGAIGLIGYRRRKRMRAA